MHVDFDPTSNVVEVTSVSNSHIISEFVINNSSFLVISLEDHVINNQDFLPNIIINSIPYSVIGKFQSDGHDYAIVRTQSTIEKIDSSLINILTKRELQIAALVALGCPNKKVANQLQISEWTVSAHLRRIFIKLKVDSRSAMVYRCASLINRLHELRTIQDQMLSKSQSRDAAQSVINQETFQYDIVEIDRLLCSVLATSSIRSD